MIANPMTMIGLVFSGQESLALLKIIKPPSDRDSANTDSADTDSANTDSVNTEQ